MIDCPNDLGNLIAYYVPPLAEMQMSKKEYHPYANWVRVLRPVERDSVYVQEYRLRPFDLYDGVPPWEFSTDTRWKKLPKDWTYSTDLIASAAPSTKNSRRNGRSSPRMPARKTRKACFWLLRKVSLFRETALAVMWRRRLSKTSTASSMQLIVH